MGNDRKAPATWTRPCVEASTWQQRPLSYIDDPVTRSGQGGHGV